MHKLVAAAVAAAIAALTVGLAWSPAESLVVAGVEIKSAGLSVVEQHLKASYTN